MNPGQNMKQLRKREQSLIEARARLEGVRALEPEELRRCIAVGIVDLNIIERLRARVHLHSK